MAEVDYETEYNNRARVPENPALMAGWARDAAAYREQCVPRRITYGPGSRQSIDFFAGEGRDEGNAPLVVFIHGGYWQALDGSWFSHMARGLNAHGISVAVPTYDLCPQVSVADIIEEMRQATFVLSRLSDRLIISGHSAGGHLAACMLATDWRAYDASLPPNLVRAAYAISGLFELAPLVSTSINRALGPRSDHSQSRKPVVLASRHAWQPRCGRGGVGKRGISPAKPQHCRGLGQSRPCHTVRHRLRRQSLHRDCAAGGPCLVHDLAAEGTGGSLILHKVERIGAYGTYCAELL